MLKIALIQFASHPDKSFNLEKAKKFLNSLPSDVDIAIFPEYMMGYPEDVALKEYVEKMAEDENGEFLSSLRDCVKSKGIWTIVNVFEREGKKVYNTNFVIDDSGDIVARYRKIHLFDVLGYRESDYFSAGKEITTFQYRGVKLGLATCFDLRFPEMFRKMALMGVDVFVVPSAWYVGGLKEMQWQIIGQVRAHENVAFLIAVCNSAKPFVGRSYVADPYGVIRYELGIGERCGIYEIDLKELEKARRDLPLLNLRRTDAY